MTLADDAPSKTPVTFYARPDCRFCHGHGVVYDRVDYGSTYAELPSDCQDCLEAVSDQLPADWEDSDWDTRDWTIEPSPELGEEPEPEPDLDFGAHLFDDQ